MPEIYICVAHKQYCIYVYICNLKQVLLIELIYKVRVLIGRIGNVEFD